MMMIQVVNKANSSRRLAKVAVYASVFLFALIANTSHAFSTAPYFPLTQGAQWTYSSSDGTFTQSILGVGVFNGAPVVVLGDSKGRRSYYTNDANGIRQHGEFDPNVSISGVTFQAIGILSPPQILANADATLGIPVTSSGDITIT